MKAFWQVVRPERERPSEITSGEYQPTSENIAHSRYRAAVSRAYYAVFYMASARSPNAVSFMLELGEMRCKVW